MRSKVQERDTNCEGNGNIMQQEKRSITAHREPPTFSLNDILCDLKSNGNKNNICRLSKVWKIQKSVKIKNKNIYYPKK